MIYEFIKYSDHKICICIPFGIHENLQTYNRYLIILKMNFRVYI